MRSTTMAGLWTHAEERSEGKKLLSDGYERFPRDLLSSLVVSHLGGFEGALTDAK